MKNTNKTGKTSSAKTNKKSQSKSLKSPKTIKVAINECHGGFGLSPKAIKLLAEKQGKSCYFFRSNPSSTDKFTLLNEMPSEKEWFVSAFSTNNPDEIDYDKNYINSRPKDRSDPLLIEVIEELGKEANGPFAKIKIVKIPADAKWHIEEYDGAEWVAEDHRTWN